jgi:hypothetical protein
MVLLRTLIDFETFDQIASAISTSAGARSSARVSAPYTFLSSAPAPHPHGAASDGDDINDE